MNELFVPASVRDFAFRPLNKGMMRHLPSNGLPNEACWTAQNFYAQTQGLFRRPGYQRFGGDSGTGENLPIRDMVPWYSAAGSESTLAWDDRNLFSLTASAFTQVNSTYIGGDDSIAGTNEGYTVTGTATGWSTAANNISVGDMFVLDPDGTLTAPGPHTYYVSVITSDTEMDLVDGDGAAASLPETFAAEDYIIYRRWMCNEPYFVDFAVLTGKVIFADNGRMPWVYDAVTGWGAYDSADITWQATCVGYHGDRVWFGDILDGATRYRTMIKWSTVTDVGDFAAANYLELPYTSGAMKRLVSMEDWLIAYLDDAVYVGRPTNYTDLPYSFKRIETLESGLVGMKAVCRAHGGHYFVTQDNIWKLSSRGLEPIGTPIAREALGNCGKKYLIYAAPDVPNHRVCFGIPGSGALFEKIWSYDYQSEAWSYEAIAGSCLSFRGLTFAYGWDDMKPTVISEPDTGTYPLGRWDVGMADFPSWDGIGSKMVGGELYVGTGGGRINRLVKGHDQDPDSAAIEAVFETKDIDLDMPNDDKVFERLSLKIDTFLDTDVRFKVEMSTNRGRNWTTVADPADGTQMTIPSGEDEGFVSFKGRGSTVRFRFSTETVCEPYTIIEWVLSCVGGGPEKHREVQS